MDTVIGSNPGAGNIKVVVRCRPLNAREQARGAKCLIRMEGDQTTIFAPGTEDTATKDKDRDRREHSFTFDKSYWSAGSKDETNYASQQTLYDDVGVELLDHSFAGYNCCIFAYGQTGSGKSYSMMGYGSDKGVIPLVTEELFNRIDRKAETDPAVEHRVEVSYMEIYNEKVRDLLNPKNKGVLRVREHPSLGPYVEDLSRLVVESYSQMMTVMDEGNKARTVASTAMNETSSRSHAVFTVILTQKRQDETTLMAGEKVSKVSLVDLAGSERANSTGATGARLKEGANINRSLTTLGKVIQALASAGTAGHKNQKKKKDDFVPYRDSVLTWLLKESLGGNSRTCMIAAISPADYDETLSTLRYADQAKRIKTNAVVNEDPNAKMIRELKEELAVLRQRAVGGSAEAIFDESTPPEKQIVTYKTKDGELKKVTKLELQENLEASEKLMATLNESWEDKLAKTQEIHIAREQALEELGITLDNDRALVGVHAPKKWPHLVNLNEDPLQNECLLYSIPEGRTIVGNTESMTAAIKLSSPRIMQEHCEFTNNDGRVSIKPLEQSIVLVNGKPISIASETFLESGFRIIIDWHVFRFSSPQSVRAQRMKESVSFSGWMPETQFDGTEPSDLGRDAGMNTIVDWSFARKEALSRLTYRGEDLDLLGDEELDELFQDITKARIFRRRPESQAGTPDRIRARQVMTGGQSVEDMSTPEGIDSIAENPWQGDGYREDSMVTNPAFGGDGTKRTLDGAKSTSSVSDGESFGLQHRHQNALREQAPEIDLMTEEIRRLRQIALQNRFESLNSRLSGILLDHEKTLARKAVDIWRKVRVVATANALRRGSDMVDEANRLAKQHGVDIAYRLTVGPDTPVSVMETSVESIFFDAEATHSMSRSSGDVLVLSIDTLQQVIEKWPLERLERQIPLMRAYNRDSDQAHRPAVETVFRSSPSPCWSLLGTAVFALRQGCSGAMRVPIHSYDVGEAIGNLAVHTEWRHPQPEGGPSDVTQVTIRLEDVRAFSEGVSLAHMQIRLPTFGIGGRRENLRASDVADLTIGSTSQLKLSENYVLDKALGQATQYICVDFFGQVQEKHLQQLLDRIPKDTLVAEQSEGSLNTTSQPVRHTLGVYIALLEPNSQGAFVPVDCDRKSDVFSLRQGRQRRLKLTITHNSARILDYRSIDFVTVQGQQGAKVVRLEALGQYQNEGEHAESQTCHPVYREDGTATWSIDYKFEDLPGMERRTGSGDNTTCQFSFQVSFKGYRQPALFVLPLSFRISASDSRRRSSILDYLRTNTMAAHSSRTFELVPPSEEASTLSPSHTAMISAYLDQRRRQHLVADVQANTVLLRTSSQLPTVKTSHDDLQRRAIEAWTATCLQRRFPADMSKSLSLRLSQEGKMQISEVFISSRVDKDGWLDVLSSPATHQTTRRWARLTRPYLRLFESNDLRQEIQVISLVEADINETAELGLMLGTTNMFLVAARTNTSLFQTTSSNERDAWIKALAWK